MSDMINVRCWQLVDTRGTAFKFYNIYLAESHVITQWGRIDSPGQTRVESFPSLREAALSATKTNADKLRKGYDVARSTLELKVPRSVIANIVLSGGSAAAILKQPQHPPAPPVEPLNGSVLLGQANHLLTNLKALSNQADNLDLDVLLDRWSEISAVWDDLAATHREADLLVATVRAQVTQRVMGG